MEFTFAESEIYIISDCKSEFVILKVPNLIPHIKTVGRAFMNRIPSLSASMPYVQVTTSFTLINYKKKPNFITLHPTSISLRFFVYPCLLL